MQNKQKTILSRFLENKKRYSRKWLKLIYNNEEHKEYKTVLT